jgi:hypothetical protein
MTIRTLDTAMATHNSVMFLGGGRDNLDVFFVLRGGSEGGFCHGMEFSSCDTSRNFLVEVTGVSAMR